MQIKPTYIFEDTTSTGIDKVPLNAAVIIKDSDGTGTPAHVIKIDQGVMDQNTTIATFLADGTLFGDMMGSDGDILGGTY